MNSRDVLTRPAPGPDRTLAYGTHPDQVIDIRGEGPLIVFVHGGFWRAEYDRSHAGPLACALAELGYTVATCEYRRTGQPGGGWPGTFDDVSQAVTAIPDLLGTDIALLMGHSAGGHLALWVASRAPVLALAPVAGLAEAYTQWLGDGAVAALLGGSPEEYPDRYVLGEPGRSGVLVHGLDDAQVPIDLSRNYAARTGSRLVELVGVEHFGLIDPLAECWPVIRAEIGALASPGGG